MREIKKLTKSQLRNALNLAVKAYPMMSIASEQQLLEFETRILEDFNREYREWYGLFEAGQLLGTMVLYDFTMNYYGTDIKARGIGFVAVDFLHKKQKVCKQLLHWYLDQSLTRAYPLAILYAFRPDFYKKMGFGYGTSCFKYVTSPGCIPKTETSYPLAYLSQSDTADVSAFYQTLCRNYHGMIPKRDKDIEAMLKTPGVYVVGHRENRRLNALLIFRLKADECTNQATHMKLELLFTNANGVKAALNFLNSQADQVSEITLATPFRDFFFNLADIRHSDHKILKDPGFHHVYDAGMGMMFRSLNPVELVLKRPCSLDNLRIRFLLQDKFLEGSREDFCIEWKAGKAKLSKSGKANLELRFDIADFSSWIMNAIDLTTLHQFGLVEVSDTARLTALDQAFYYQQKPICLISF